MSTNTTSRCHTPRPLPPEMSRYHSIRIVGQGSFGAAILVTRGEEQFIAKEMNIGKMSPVERESVDTEIKILSALSHPNIVRYEECVAAGHILYIVMEFADGGDLYQRIQSLERPMSEDGVLYIFAQICLAVRHLHSRKILHRDLKTQNVFMTKDNIVKLGDFGLATALRHTWQQAHSLCGTPHYFSPELVAGRPYNNKADIWSMGCILYELLTQRFAFTGTTLQEIMSRIQCEQPAPIPQHYSDGLKRILSRMLCKEQAIRPNIDALMRANILKSALHRIYAVLAGGNSVQTSTNIGSPQLDPGIQLQHVDNVSSTASVPVKGRTEVTAVAEVSEDFAVVGSPQTREEDLMRLENEILFDHLRGQTHTTSANTALLEEVTNSLATVRGADDEEEDDTIGGEEFGDEYPLAAQATREPTHETPKTGNLETSLEGEVFCHPSFLFVFSSLKAF
eukprot:TRINITY_DN2832_c1_g1_i1.p1 TRINITY_DN2832_c1_g1~~TRINITY_DN2832_c1_g1_i1.p1  ORF type:complete len:465 (+),score=54.64 TRINITY_DN2832_c1_g1_i1:42-1397(+)